MPFSITINDSIDLKKTFNCGQCFRWVEKSGWFEGVVLGEIHTVKHSGGKLIIDSQLPKAFWNNYFDLGKNYNEINKKLIKDDPSLKKIIEHGKGIRILNQPFEEVLFTFIISQNNNITRIKKNIADLSKLCGKKITGCDMFSFPTATQIINRYKKNKQGFEELKLGYRLPYIIETAKNVASNKKMIEAIGSFEKEKKIDFLISQKGVGPKVLSCILLFSLNEFDVFPIDTRIKQIMGNLYGLHTHKDIEDYTIKAYGGVRGLVQQYLFYYSFI